MAPKVLFTFIIYVEVQRACKTRGLTCGLTLHKCTLPLYTKCAMKADMGRVQSYINKQRKTTKPARFHSGAQIAGVTGPQKLYNIIRKPTINTKPQFTAQSMTYAICI